MTGKWGWRHAVFSHGTRLPGLVLLVAVALLASSAGAMADDPDGSEDQEVEMGFPLSLSGELETQATAGAFQVGPLSEVPEEFAFWLEAESMDVRVMNLTKKSLTGSQEGERIIPARETAPRSTKYGPFEEATVRLSEADKGFYLLVHSSEGEAEHGMQTLSGEATLDQVPEGRVLSMVSDPGPNHHTYTVQEDQLGFFAADPFTEIVGDFTVVLFETVFAVDHADGSKSFHTGRSSSGYLSHSLSIGSPVDPMKNTHTEYAVLKVTDGRLAIRTVGPEAELIAPFESMKIDVDGTVEAPTLLGTLKMDEERVRVEGDSARMEGRFTMQPVSQSGSDKAMFSFDGEVDTLTVGAQEYHRDGRVTQAAGLAILIAGAAAGVWQVAKSGLLVPLYAKLTRRKVLDQSTRQQVHDKIQSDPGCTTRSVSSALGISWSTAAYHLRVLRHMGLITSKRQGRHEHFFVTGEASQTEQAVKAALQNPTTRKIAQLIAQNPGVIQKEVCERLGIAPSTASDHLKRLREAGAVREERQWRTRSYHPAQVLLEGEETLPGLERYSVPVASAGTSA